MKPTKEQADQFALLLSTGMPSAEAIRYFVESETVVEDIRILHDRWIRSREVANAVKRMQGKSWEDMNLQERMSRAIDKQYTEMAYFLYANNYNDLKGHERAKADTCRQALEAKLAGLSGKMDALSRFFDDVLRGVVKLPATPIAVTLPLVPIANMAS